MTKIAIAGTGDVGLSNAVLLVQQNDVMALLILLAKVNMINCSKLPIVNTQIEHF